MMVHMDQKPNIKDVLILNLRALMRATKMKKPQLAKKSGISPRMIAYILAGDKIPTTETVDALASAFGLNGWQLLMPGIQIDLAKFGKVDNLIKHYTQSSEQGREWIDRVAEQEAKYTGDKRVA